MDRTTIRPRPNLGQQPAPHQAPVSAPQPPRPAKRRRMPTRNSGIAIVVLFVLLLTGLLCWWKMSSGGLVPRSDRYQAVFLSNGQVFFGKLTNIHGPYLRLEKAYYTKKAELPDNATEEQRQATNNNISLVKVGDEVYGPENYMTIKSDQVLFWQDLKTDSKVTKAIDDK